MAPRDLLAIIANPRSGFTGFCADAVHVDEFAAVFANKRMRQRMGRKAAARAAYERQHGLEQLMNYGTVLPALPGVNIRPDQLRLAVKSHRHELTELARRLQEKCQFQLQILYDHEKAARWQGTDPAATHAAMRHLFTDRANELLAPLEAETIDLPVTAGLALNRVLLIDAAAEPLLDRAIKAIDALWTEGLSIRQIGPSPAVSFASLTFRPVSKARLSKARNDLGLSPQIDGQDIAAARRMALMKNPDRAQEIKASAEILHAASGADGTPCHRLVLWSEAQAAPDSAERHVA